MLKAWTTTLTAILLSCSSMIFADDLGDWPFQDIPTAGTFKLSEGWRFAWDGNDQGMNDGWFTPEFSRESWKPVAVPGVWDMAPGGISTRARHGIGWFSCTLKLPERWEGEPAVVFLGAMYMADVWFGGEYLGSHRGGYAPFMFSLDGKLEPGKDKELIVRVDNRLSPFMIPGNNLGWNAYGGITREVFLICRPRLRVEELRTSTTLKDDGTAHLSITGKIANTGKLDCDRELSVCLKDGERKSAQTVASTKLKAGSSEPLKIEFDIPDARLWSPDDPFLHTLEFSWAGDQTPHLSLPLGLREIRIEGKNFLLNGKRFWLQGFGRHEDCKDYGPCMTPDMNYIEISRMKNFGANHLRTGHYPNHPSVYAACDRIGLLAFTEIPVWQLNRNWMQSEQAWNEWAEPQLSEMILWYGGFTSVISWGAANEMGGTPEYNRRAVAYIKEKDPARIPMIVIAANEDRELYKLLPMAGRNLHYGWYHSRRVYNGLRTGLAENAEWADSSNTPIWVAELGGQGMPDSLNGGYNDETRGSETYLDKIVRFGFQYAAVASERVCGISVWTWSDFCRDHEVNAHGIFGYGREKKIVAYTVRNLFEGDLRVYLCEDDSTCSPGGLFHAKAYVFNPKLGKVANGLSIGWRIMHGTETLAAGKAQVPDCGTSRSTEAADISWNIPADTKGMFSLWAELLDGDGKLIHTNSVHFGAGTPAEKPGRLALTALSKGKAADAIAELAGIRIPVYADPGLIIPLPEGEYDMAVRCAGEEHKIKVKIASGKTTEEKVEFNK